MQNFSRLLVLAALASTLSSLACAQQNSQSEGWLQSWNDRTTAIQARQPGWSVPIFAPYPMLIQVFRADFQRQITPAETTTWNYGGSKGLNIIPFQNTEFDIYYPPYIQHNSSAKDGFGDVTFLGKYRILSGNEKHGNYLLSFLLIASIPTGSYKNGAPNATVNPTLAAGKGLGKFDVQTTLGATLPVSQGATLGKPVVWNVTGQFHAGKWLWPELESNATYFHGGPNDGKTQEFLTPGLTTSKFKFHPEDAHSRVGFAAGAGMQIAASQLHTYNHNLIFSGRLLF